MGKKKNKTLENDSSQSTMQITEEGLRQNSDKEEREKNVGLDLEESPSRFKSSVKKSKAKVIATEFDEAESKRSKNKREKKSKTKDEKEGRSNEDPENESLKRKASHEIEETNLGLGVVDTDILKQAGTNLGLPIEEEGDDTDKLISSEPKKKKKKKEKKAGKELLTSETQTSTENKEDKALKYLSSWHVDKKNWKFCKLLQIKLLHIMYDREKMDDETFALMLLYLEGLNGKSRDKTRDEAQKLLTESESENNADTTNEERARQIFQLLS